VQRKGKLKKEMQKKQGSLLCQEEKRKEIFLHRVEIQDEMFSGLDATLCGKEKKGVFIYSSQEEGGGWKKLSLD